MRAGFESPAHTDVTGTVAHICNPGAQGNRDPRDYWPDNTAKMVPGKNLSQVRWRIR